MLYPAGDEFVETDHVVAPKLEPGELAVEPPPGKHVPARPFSLVSDRVIHEDGRAAPEALPRLSIDALPNAPPVAVALEEREPSSREGVARHHPAGRADESRRKPQAEQQLAECNRAPAQLAGSAEPEVWQKLGVPPVQEHADDAAPA